MLIRLVALICLTVNALFLAGPTWASSSQNELRDLADQAAKRYGIDHHLFRALIQHESTWRPHVVSSRGAVGLAQIMPNTAKAECGLNRKDLLDPELNLNCGARYLAKQIERFGSVKQALCAFNAGPNITARLGRCPNYRVTLRYVEKILTTREDSYFRMNGL